MDAIPRIKILYPPMKTQIVVGSFLDKKSAELDQLIGAKQRLLKLLDEKNAPSSYIICFELLLCHAYIKCFPMELD
jgi:hypothetical protein